MSVATVSNGALAALGGRLAVSEDQAAYARLVSYISSLPAADEFRQLTELLGLLTLIGERIPVAAVELVAEIRAQTETAAEYHAAIEARLASLPSAITAGIDITAMREAFRQQIAAIGLQEATNVLSHAANGIKTVTAETLAPAASEYKRISTNIAAEAQKLAAAGEQLRLENLRLIRHERHNRLLWVGMLCVAVLVVGMLAGIAIEKKQTGRILLDLRSNICAGSAR